MTLNDTQRKQVEDNMGLVGKVIKDKAVFTRAAGSAGSKYMKPPRQNRGGSFYPAYPSMNLSAAARRRLSAVR